MLRDLKAIAVQPVVLCGGSGTRLWPLSRTGFPKQFLCIAGDQSLFQRSIQRMEKLNPETFQIASPVVVAGEEHRFLVLEQMREVGSECAAVILELAGRNTAPALTMAALAALETGGDPVLVVTPSDQTVTDTVAFLEAVSQSIRDADRGSIVILGITPTHAETGYGYIQAMLGAESVACDVLRFVEKPNRETAQQYLADGNYFWNAGIFVLKASVWLKALQHFRPQIDAASRAAWAGRTSDTRLNAGEFIRPEPQQFQAIPSESVDYAVMEHCPGSPFAIRMVPLDAGWSDVGSWDSVWNISSKDSQGNAIRGDVVEVDTQNTFVHASSRLVSMLGVRDLVVVETPDAVLIADKTRSQGVKEIVAALALACRQEIHSHRKVHRPWGWYDSVEEGERFKVKRIQVKPHASLSLQKHAHRAEHWIVVSGVAEITCGEKTFLLRENQSAYIPRGEIHRLANPQATPLDIIEVQSGDYLGEDDIVRFADQYGR